MCAELMLAELTVLMRAELNDLPGSDIIEHKIYSKSLIFHIPFSNLAQITKGKVSNRHAAATDDLSKIDPKSELKLLQKQVKCLPNSDSKHLSLNMMNIYLHMLNCGISNCKSCMSWFSGMVICTIFKFLDPVYTIRCHRPKRKLCVAIKRP